MKENRRKQSALSEDARNSLLWAFYSKLPESYKNGFTRLAYSLAKEPERRILSGGVQSVSSDPQTFE